MALNNLDRFVAQARNPLSIGTLFERDATALPTLIQIFSTSQHFSDLLIADPEGLDLLRLTEGAPVARQMLVEDLVAEISALEHEQTVLRSLRRFKRRETLRITYGDIIREQSLQTVTAQISYLADAILEGALRAAWRKLRAQRGDPIGPDGQTARFVILGMGKLGGCELNYSSDIDLIFLYDGEGKTNGPRPVSNHEFFEHLARELVRLLTENTELGMAYRVDLRLRPDGQRGPMVMGLPAMLTYYDVRGRTWERQAYIKARPVAGDLDLGNQFLAQLSPWIYRRYLSRADIGGIKALKRRIEQKVHGDDQVRDVKVGHGGIRDIEFVIQFLQLLNGGDLPQLRTGNTLEAMARLEQCGCLTNQERVAAGRELQLPPQDRAPPADPLRSANAHACRPTMPSCGSWPCGWATKIATRSTGCRGRPWRAFWPTTAKRPRSTARSSTTCCTTPSATTSRPRPRPTWSSIPTRSRS